MVLGYDNFASVSRRKNIASAQSTNFFCAQREFLLRVAQIFFSKSFVLVENSGMDAHTVKFLMVNMVIRAAYLSDGDEGQIWEK